MKKWTIIILTILVLGVLAYVVGSIMAYRQTDDQIICQGVHIDIADSTTLGFVDRQDILLALDKHQMNPIGKAYADINPEQLQQLIRKNKMVKDARCYKMVNGVVKIEVDQREPVFRVNARNDFYIDRDREPMPTSRKCVCYVPVVTGEAEEKFVTGPLFDFIITLEKDTFWSNQVEQINIGKDQDLALVPRVGNHIINLGQLENATIKLAKLRELYREGFNKNGWPENCILDLQYKDQVVCRKRAE